jgi:hypothetical protein
MRALKFASLILHRGASIQVTASASPQSTQSRLREDDGQPFPNLVKEGLPTNRPESTHPLCARKKRPRGRAPGSIVKGLTDRPLSCRSGDDFPRRLVVGDALSDPRRELRCVALHHLPDARPKLVEEVHPRVAANRRTKIVERCRRGTRPIWTVSSGDSDRSQSPKEIRSVQPPLSGVVTRKIALSYVGKQEVIGCFLFARENEVARATDATACIDTKRRNCPLSKLPS